MPERLPKTVAYLGIGSNVEPEASIERALELIAREVDLLGVSTFYRCEALGRPEQPEFLNGACRIATAIEPRALKFDVLRGVEGRLGRARSADKCAPRTIDLDILLYGDVTCDEQDLHIPDPEIRTRPFVAVPLLELAPDAVLPGTGERLADVPAAQQGDRLRPDLPFTEHMRERFGR